MKKHPLIETLLGLRGNPRGCVYSEPLWGIPFNLYSPYASVFMVALGLADSQIGLVLSVSWAFQVVFSLLSGAITDKLGRRLTTLIFDLVSWGLASLISALAQNFWYFLVAGIVNSVYRVTQNSWSCLLVEDADPEKLVGIYSWIYISNIVAGFAAPLAGLLIAKYELPPTVRGLYFFAAAMFSIKALVTYALTKETGQGIVRMRETRGRSLASILAGYGGVLRALLSSRQTLYLAAIMVIVNVTSMISGGFWAILATGKLGLPASMIAGFPFVKSAILFLLLFTVTPRLAKLKFRVPMALGFGLFAASQLLYAMAPERGYLVLIAGVILEAGGLAVATPLVDRLTVLAVDPAERARILSMLFVCVILVSSPFGWIAGELAQLDNSLPFVLNLALYCIGALLALAAGRRWTD
jgi:MFS family permease